MDNTPPSGETPPSLPPKSPMLPESLTTVTPLSKALALTLFILLPFLGFLFGVEYGHSIAPRDVPAPVTPVLPGDPTPPVGGIETLPAEGGSSPAQPGPNDAMPPVDVGVPGTPPEDADDTPVPPPQATSECGVTNCHGMDITCGNVSEPIACTMMYQIGDGCRQFASCGVVDGQCAPLPSARFSACKSCVEKCLELPDDDPSARFTCENACLQ